MEDSLMRKLLSAGVAPFFMACAASTLLAAPALAASANLETFSGYTDGNINGQGGWSNTGNYDANVKTLGGGNKVLQLSNSKTSGSFGDMPIAPLLSESAGESSTGAPNNHFVTSFDFRDAVDYGQTGLYVDLSPDDGTGGRQAYIGISDDGTSGLKILAYDYNPGTMLFDEHDLITLPYSLDWHNIMIDMTFLDGPTNDIVKYFVDGTLLATLNSWEQFYIDDSGQAALHPNGVDVRTNLFRMNGGPFGAQPQLAGYGILVDNLSYSASVVPIPGAALLFASGLLGLGFSSRKTKPQKPTADA
jgi:hypothetical protein